MTNSVRLTFLPGSSYNLDKKSANWNVTTVDEYGMSINLKFDNPIYIARDELLDLLKVSFHNTEFYLNPVNETKRPPPSGYSTVVELPPQTDNSMA